MKPKKYKLKSEPYELIEYIRWTVKNKKAFKDNWEVDEDNNVLIKYPERFIDLEGWFGEVSSEDYDMWLTNTTNGFYIKIGKSFGAPFDHHFAANNMIKEIREALKWYKEERFSDEELRLFMKWYENVGFYPQARDEILYNQLEQILHNRKEEK